MIPATLFTDPGCPFGYSAAPALARLRWRYGDALDWRLVMIGLAETGDEYAERGYTAAWMAGSLRRFRRYGMPLVAAPKERLAGTSRACRAVIAVRRRHPGREWAALRALQFLQFTTPCLLDDDDDLTRALARVPGVDAEAVVADVDSDAVREAYEADRALARTASGTAASLQGKTAGGEEPGEPERFTAPSVVFDERWVVGGFQPYAAYDAMVANLAPDVPVRPAPEDPLVALAAFPDGLTSAEVAAVMAPGVEDPDPRAGEDLLIEAAASGVVERVRVGDDALWRKLSHDLELPFIRTGEDGRDDSAHPERGDRLSARA